jgi:hypothetical protein
MSVIATTDAVANAPRNAANPALMLMCSISIDVTIDDDNAVNIDSIRYFFMVITFLVGLVTT